MSLFSKTVQTVEIDYDKLAQAIVNAQEKTDKEAIKNAVIAAHDELDNRKTKECEKANAEWQKALGLSVNEKPNELKVLFKILFLRKEKAKFNVANNVLVKIALILSYIAFEFLIYAGIVLFVIVSILSKSLTMIMFLVPMGFIAFLFARIIRIARFEIDSINDKDYLVNLLSNNVSVIAMIVAIVALLRGVAI